MKHIATYVAQKVCMFIVYVKFLALPSKSSGCQKCLNDESNSKCIYRQDNKIRGNN